MKDTALLKKMVCDRNTTLEAVANVLEIDRSTLYRKTKGGLDGLTIREARKISGFLSLSESEASCVFRVR